jgi:hypothetical protein
MIVEKISPQLSQFAVIVPSFATFLTTRFIPTPATNRFFLTSPQ